jgi:hypothetical protein
MPTPTPQPIPVPHPPSSPLTHFLVHPGKLTDQIYRHLSHDVLHLASVLGVPVIVICLVVVATLLTVRRNNGLRMNQGAQLVRILAPPDVDPQGAATLWTNLVALLRPGRRRLLGGQPHLGFEITALDGGLSIAIWVPGGVPTELVSRAVESAWPGARTETGLSTPPLSESVESVPGHSTGGCLRLAMPEQYSLRTDHKVDPLRPLIGALSALGEEDSACVQILARPLSGRRLSALHKAAAARRNGQSATHLSRLLDLATPGSSTKSSDIDPTRGADVADILEKSAQPCWAISLRYAVATTERDKRAVLRIRGRAHAVASAFALFSGRNRFDRRRLKHPAAALAGRRLGRGDLVSVAELAALAHLPTDASVPGLARAGA